MNLSKDKTKAKELSFSERKQSFSSVIFCYTKEEAIEEANRCLMCPKPTCIDGCPIHNNIPAILKAVREEKFIDAYSLLKKNTCFPDICGSICPHEKQCEGHCVRSKVKDGVNFGAVERFIAEYAHDKGIDKLDIKHNGKKVAIIGSGPAGLSCAIRCLELGFQVTIFEKENHLGGILFYGIPTFRLDKKYLDQYIEKLSSNNVAIKLGVEVGKDISLSDIQSSYDSVFIGIGAQNQNSLQIADKNEKYVTFASDFLAKINTSKIDNNGKKVMKDCGENVVVVGGGNAAMDAARNAIRLPQVKSVKIVYRRTENEMPAYQSELNDAKLEGIEFLPLTNPIKFNYKKDVLKSIECAIMKLGEPDASGRRRPIESSKPHINLQADTVILALGSSNTVDFAKDIDIQLDEWGAIKVNENSETSVKNIYAGGDAVTGPLTVVSAMKSGIKAANHMYKKLFD